MTGKPTLRLKNKKSERPKVNKGLMALAIKCRLNALITAADAEKLSKDPSAVQLADLGLLMQELADQAKELAES